MKKITSLILTFALLFAFVSCTDKSNSPDKSETANSAVETTEDKFSAEEQKTDENAPFTDPYSKTL